MKVAILLGTYNGQDYIQEQLDSFESQSHTDWNLWVSDDGSIDNTVSIVRDFSKKIGSNRVNQVSGPKKGFATNFLGLIRNLNINADAYAYSDQDDIWMADKLERAVCFLSSVSVKTPALYCSRTIYVDKNNQHLKPSQNFKKSPSFSNALVQNIASGNTMVFNEAARSLLLQLHPDTKIDLHDWVTYILVTGAGGQVCFDQNPSVRYRQHSRNLIGMNVGMIAAIRRFKMLLKGRFREWNDTNEGILKKMDAQLTSSNRIVFNEFIKARHSKGISRLTFLIRSGVYRQTFLNSLALYFAALISKV